MPEQALHAKNPVRVFTIGHSNRSMDDFLELLRTAGIKALADIRRFPGSRMYPHFNRESLSVALSSEGIAYEWIERLGGRRPAGRKDAPSPNRGLRNASFRAYADYMATPAFEDGLAQLLELARARPTAMMCAEAVYWRCHRRLVSDCLTARGVEVLHIQDRGKPQPHALTPGAVAAEGRVSYPTANANAHDLPLFPSTG